MAFGNASLPTRKYVYGAREFLPGARLKDANDNKLPRLRFPGHDLAVEQLRLAHRYQNKLVEIERARRAEANRIIHDAFPDLAELLATAEALDAELDALRADLSRANSTARVRNADPELAARTRTLSTDRRAAWQAHRARKALAYADLAARAALDANDTAATAAGATARNEAVANGLYWATSLIVAPRVKKTGPPPKFKGWCGEGLIAVQFQRKPDKSSPRVAVLATDGQPRVHPRSGKPTMRYESGSSLRTSDSEKSNTLCWIEREPARPKFATVHFRVGSDNDGAPEWASLPIVLHRPLPPNAEIKWAYLSRRKTGTHYKWEVHFDIAMSADAWTVHDGIRDAARNRTRATSGTVAVALGWRMIDGDIRVAVWKGSDGEDGAVTIPRQRVASWAQCDELRSIRDTQFDADRAFLVEWLRSQTLPPEWMERTETLHAWRSAARLAALVIWWRLHRLPGDEAAFARMEGDIVPAPRVNGVRVGHDHYSGGRKQNKHLYDWSENRRAKCRAWRKDFYRAVAIELSTRYRNVVIADIDWHAIAENPAPEDATGADVNKTYRGMAACASLRDELTDLLVECRVPAPGITVTCHRCGGACPPPGAGRWVRCERCGGERMDRAENAASNLLLRAAGAETAV